MCVRVVWCVLLLFVLVLCLVRALFGFVRLCVFVGVDDCGWLLLLFVCVLFLLWCRFVV